MTEYCDFFWGSHGCSLPPGHEEQMHTCYLETDDDIELCSQFDPYALVYSVRFFHYEAELPGWGRWINWGSGFSNHDPNPIQMNC